MIYSVPVGPWYSLAHPLAGAIFLRMMAGCGLRALSRRGVRWKGRRYPGVGRQ